MSSYTKVKLCGDTRGRLNISVVDDDGCGHGHRLTGPKYINDIVSGNRAPETIRVELDADDVDALHEYLRYWDEINLDDGRDDSAVWLKLVAASDRYRKAETSLHWAQAAPGLPAQRYAEMEKERDQTKAQLVESARALIEAWGA